MPLQRQCSHLREWEQAFQPVQHTPRQRLLLSCMYVDALQIIYIYIKSIKDFFFLNIHKYLLNLKSNKVYNEC